MSPDIAFLKILALKLLDRVAARRKRLCDDMVADALDELVDSITETIGIIRKLAPVDEDLIAKHLRAHAQDHEARSAPSIDSPAAPAHDDLPPGHL